ncbi:DUF6318 family protein [Rothia mucilaginosa]|uniref:DUF6318 family protein n=1 Tax=Rothia mucilaginosa TaxID=43675 RepID=UPI00206B5F8B|nr:DUF6318 family protein [Rothia mucilaginosa]UQF82222.1 MAG: DUF6318 family protein [Rothia mucilaginosa]
MLNRRALLAGAVSLGASTLLAACNQQANHEASVSSTATDTLPAAPSETASATASPSTVRGYSGGSKAPEGEYRKADKHGNAQNVPKPNVPEDGYNEKSPEGIRKTLDAWTQWANYGTQTGDFTMARQFVSPTFESELNAYADIEDLYKSGGWVIGGVDHFLTEGAPWSEDEETYFWKAYREWDYETYVESDGSWRRWENKDKTKNTFKFELKHNGQKWEIMGYKGVDK